MLSVPLLASMPAVARDRALATADRVATASQRWLADHARPFAIRPDPAVLASQVATHSIAVTLGLPGLPVPDLTTLTCLRLWVHALPDQPDADDLCAATLPVLRRRLSRRPLFALFGRQWYAGLRDAARAAATERAWRGTGAAVPGWEQYLENATTALALRPFTLAACVLTSVPDGWAELARLDAMLHAAARCLRLAGDLNRHAHRPDDCGLTAAVLVQRGLVAQGAEKRPAFNHARAHLRAKCAVDLAFLRTQAQVAPPARAGLAHALYAYTTFVCQSYELSDYHAARLAAA